MAHPKAVTPPARPPESARPGELLVPLGVLLSLALPFFFFSVASTDALRESKLLVQALGAALVLAGLALDQTHVGVPPADARAAALLLGAALLLALVSGGANAGRIDPLSAGAVLPVLALVLAGASKRGVAAQRRAFAVVAVAGAFTGALAALQRFTGVFRLPLETPEPRFLAAALIGNPGDVGAALVVPGLLLWARLTDSGPAPRSRVLAAGGFLLVLAGLGASESLAPLAALGAGIAAHLLFDLRRRWKPFAVATVAFLAALVTTGAGGRAFVKLAQLRRGQVGAAATQRDIGVLAAIEMVRVHPLLGVGPGAFSGAFVPARIAAEERTGRRLRHYSDSAHFENAHSEPLTLAAECGIPAAALAVAGIVVVLKVLARRREDLLFALLFAFGVLSLGSFPLRLAVACGPVAFILGLAFRTARTGDPRSGERTTRGRWALAIGAVLTVSLAAARSAATWWQAAGENGVRVAALLEGPARADLLSDARASLRRSLTLRPRSATAWLALGSTYRVENDYTSALASYERSLSLEERAETDFNVGSCLLRLSSFHEAHPFFLRALWILPRLRDSLPPEVDGAAVEAEVKRLAEQLKAGGRAPALPVAFRRPL